MDHANAELGHDLVATFNLILGFYIKFYKDSMVVMIKRSLTIFIILSLFSHVTISAQISDSVEIAPAWHQNKVVSVLLVPSILIGTGIATMNDNGDYFLILLILEGC
jgi:hypothetical protein